jgi:hypothetical protein
MIAKMIPSIIYEYLLVKLINILVITMQTKVVIKKIKGIVRLLPFGLYCIFTL